MHATKVILAIATLAGYAAAQQWTVDNSCAAAYIVEACIKDRQPQLDKCYENGNDYECLCNQFTALATCYNNCPNDPSVSSVGGSVTSYCGAYSATLSSTSSVAPSTTSGGSSNSPSPTSTSGSSNNEGSSSTSTAASTTSTADTGAGFAVTPARSYGFLAGFLAVAGAFL